MKMNKKPLFLFLLLLLLLPVVATAQVGASDDEKLSEQEKKEMVAFTKRFVAQLHKTRDIAPLIREFFLPISDISAFLANDLKEEGGYVPSPEESKRLLVVTSNLIYIDSLAQIIAGDDYRVGLRSILPARLAHRLDDAFDDVFDPLEKNNRRQFRAVLRRVERDMKAAQQHLRRKNFERTVKYEKAIAERLKEDVYNFDIYTMFSAAREDSETMDRWLRRFGADTRAYNIGVPYGFAPTIVKLKTGYKILFLFPHPLSG